MNLSIQRNYSFAPVNGIVEGDGQWPPPARGFLKVVVYRAIETAVEW
jgi:hypothetical protein